MEINYIVVGAGFSGSVVAERIATELGEKVLVIEKRDHIGGNAYDYWNKYGVCIHKYGPHLFHTKYKEVWDYLSQFTKWNKYNHRVLGYMDGQFAPIPFNLTSLYRLLPVSLARRIERKLIENYGMNQKVPILELNKSQDVDLKLLADYIYQKIYLGYNLKQWGVKPDDLDPSVSGRVPVYVSYDDRYFQDQYQGIPLNGYTALIKKMLNNQNIHILLNTDYKELLKFDLESNKITYNGKVFKGKIIFTGCLDELANYKFGKLRYRSLKFKHKTIDRDFFQDKLQVNYCSDGDFTRIIEYKHLYKHPTINKTTIVYEYPYELKSDLDIPYYPIVSDEQGKLYSRYRKEIEKLDNLLVLGRLGDYKYYNMDDTVLNAINLFNEKINK